MTPSIRFRLTSRSTLRVALSALATIVTACAGGSSVTGPTTPPPAVTPGWLTIQLDSPRADDGAVQLLVTGPGIDSVKAVGYDGYAQVVNGEGNLLVTGSVVSGSLAQVHVADVARSAEFHASVVAAAARATYVLQDLSGYRAVLVR